MDVCIYVCIYCYVVYFNKVRDPLVEQQVNFENYKITKKTYSLHRLHPLNIEIYCN